jgi:predicted nicotinamide N-methyase
MHSDPETDLHDSDAIAWSGGKIVIKQGSGAVVGTGAVVSASAKSLLEYMHAHAVNGTVLELGSGTGVVAIGLATQGCSVVATDVATNPHGFPRRALESATLDAQTESDRHAKGNFVDLLQVIERNVFANHASIVRAGGSVVARPLLWGDSAQLQEIMEQNPEGFDFIVGSEITYRVESYPLLMKVIHGASRPGTRTLLAMISALGDSQELIRVAESTGLRVHQMRHDPQNILIELSLCPT